MVYFTLNFILGMAIIGLILLMKTEDLNFRLFSIVTGVMSLLSLLITYNLKTHSAPLLVSQFCLGTFSGLFQLNQLDFATQKFKSHKYRPLFISILNLGPSLGSGIGMIVPALILDTKDD